MHTKEKLARISQLQLASTLFWLLSMLKAGSKHDRRIYRQAERKLGVSHSKAKGGSYVDDRRRKRKDSGKSRGHRSSKSRKRHLPAGIHTVRIRGKERKVKVLENGRWQFMKSS